MTNELIARHSNGYCVGDHVLAVGDVVELRIRDAFRRGRIVTDPELAGWGVAFDDGAACGLVDGFVAKFISAAPADARRERAMVGAAVSRSLSEVSQC